jgi:flagellar hook assembly protein FlgD
LGAPGVRVFDAQGRLVRTLLDRELQAGDHSVVWDGTSDLGHPATSGSYFYELEVGGQRTARKALLLR